LQPLPSLALGTFPVSPFELAVAYAALANGGLRPEPTAIQQVTDAEGRQLYRHHVQTTRVASTEQTYLLTQLLESVFADGGTAHRVAHLVKRPVAGKTGTTNSDAWMIGYTPELVTAVWVGHDRGRTISTVEAYVAAPIFAEFTEQVLAHIPPKVFPLPAGIVSLYIDEESGKIALDGCGRQRLEHFIRGTEPTEYCRDPASAEHPPLPIEPQPNEQMEQSWWRQLRDWWSDEALDDEQS
jgi:membrane carboxypeptidase/penicillin-binding protein